MDGPAQHTRIAARHTWDARDAKRLLGLVLAFLVTRALWLILNIESASYWEENYRLMAAHELLGGPLLPLFDYQADHYQGGPLVIILMAVPLFAVFGESAIVLKLVALCFAVAVLCALYVLMRVNFGSTAALIAGVVYLCGPPLVAYSSLLTMGSHGESTLFSLAQLILLFGMLTGRWRTTAAWGVFGLTSGLGLWFCYTSGVSLAACGLVWLLVEGVPRPREIAAAILGAAIGLIPWLAYNMGREFIGLTRVFELFGYGDPVDPWAKQSAVEKLGLLLGRDLPAGILYPYGSRLGAVARGVGLVAYFGPIVFGSALALVRVLAPRAKSGVLAPVTGGDDGNPTRRLELAFFVYGIVFLGVFLFSDFTIEWENKAHAYRILLPPAVLLVIPAIITAARAIDAGGRLRVIAIAGLGVAMLASVLGTIRLASYQPRQSQALDLRGGYIVRGLLLHRKWEGDLDAAALGARVIPEAPRRFDTFMGIGWGLEFRYEKTGVIRDVLIEMQRYESAERRGLAYGIHWAMDQRIGQLRQMIHRGQATPEHALTLNRLLRLEFVVTRPDMWFRLTGEEEPPSPSK